jgi:hypothetical protein
MGTMFFQKHYFKEKNGLECDRKTWICGYMDRSTTWMPRSTKRSVDLMDLLELRLEKSLKKLVVVYHKHSFAK